MLSAKFRKKNPLDIAAQTYNKYLTDIPIPHIAVKEFKTDIMTLDILTKTE